ncbi:hypothetical protein GCK32_019135, partial [Trichostrongylus colubriformis]
GFTRCQSYSSLQIAQLCRAGFIGCLLRLYCYRSPTNKRSHSFTIDCY